jgi:hypothetical protein
MIYTKTGGFNLDKKIVWVKLINSKHGAYINSKTYSTKFIIDELPNMLDTIKCQFGNLSFFYCAFSSVNSNKVAVTQFQLIYDNSLMNFKVYLVRTTIFNLPVNTRIHSILFTDDIAIVRLRNDI